MVRTVVALMLAGLPVATASADIIEIKDPAALREVVDAITRAGFYCDHTLFVAAFKTDEYGIQYRVSCPGPLPYGTQFRLWVNPQTQRTRVQPGWGE
jgi:hypothetical protein